MSVARRAGSGAASARVQYATRRRWPCWAAAARANRNNAISSGPIITRVAKRSIAATTRTTAIPIAINISYNSIRSPPPLAVGTEPLACFLKLHFQRELNPFASISMMAARASHISTPRSALPYQCTKHESGSRPCDSGKNRSRNSILRRQMVRAWPDMGTGASRDFLKKKEPHPCLPLCFDGKRDRGEPLMLNVSLRPQPAAIAAVSALAGTSGETSSDEFLVEQIAVGSKPAMHTLFARHRTYVYRWLLRFVSNETLAEDLLSEVFLDVWRQAGRFQCRSSVSTWLMSIARHKALWARRRRT